MIGGFLALEIHSRGGTLPADLLAGFGSIAPATIGHFLDSGFMDPEIRPLFPGVKVVGPAFTVRIAANDSTLVHKAMGLVQPGDVVVIDRMGDTRHACVGEVVSLAAKLSGVAGIIIDGPATDVAEIREMGMPVFARGLSVLTTRLLGMGGAINAIVQCGGVSVRPGDLIIADDNGVLVLDPERAPAILRLAQQSEEHEVPLKERLRAGEKLPDLTGVDRLIEGDIPGMLKRMRG